MRDKCKDKPKFTKGWAKKGKDNLTPAKRKVLADHWLGGVGIQLRFIRRCSMCAAARISIRLHFLYRVPVCFFFFEGI